MQSCERRTACLPGWAALLLVQCIGSAGSEAGAAGDRAPGDPRADIPSMYHTVWSVKDGAPPGVQTLAQSSDGLLWLGAQNGLFSFDGVRFSSVRRVSSIDLPVGEVYALLAPRTGGLWISYLFGGTTFIHDGKASNYSPADGLPRSTITDFAEGSDGEIWASSPAGLLRWSQRRWEDVTERYGLPTRFLRSICIDPDKTVWLNAGGAILYLKSGAYRFETAPWHTDSANLIARSREGVPWISTHIDGHAAALHLSLRSLVKPAPEDIVWLDKADAAIDVVEESGALWIDSGVSLSRVTPMGPPEASLAARAGDFALDQASGPGVHIGFEDQEGDIWLGTTGGIDKFRYSRIRKLPLFTGDITTVAADQGALWAGLDRSPTLPGGLYEVKLGAPPRRVANVERISAGCRSRSGNVWVGGATGLWHLERDQWRSVIGPDSLRGQPETNLQAIAEDFDGNLWISVVRAGLFKRTTDGWLAYTPQNVAPKEYPLSMVTDDRGTLWLGYTRNRLIALTHQGERDYSSADGIDMGNTLALAVVDGKLWIGGNQGVSHFDGQKFAPLRFALGSPVSGVSGILQSAAGDAWLNTGAGVLHVPSSDLQAWSSDTGAPLRAELLNYLDGMLGSPTPNRPLPTVVEGSDGKIWLTTTNGIFWSEPGDVVRNTIAPSVLIMRVVADGIAFEPSQPVLLGKNIRELQIDYTATSLAIPERVMFRYRLVGHDANWQDVGARRSAFYNDLPPGHYEFRVIASNNDGVWNEAGKGLTLTLPPSLFQTVWFRLLCAATVAACLLSLFLLRVRQTSLKVHRDLEQRFNARVEERTRIARDLHDSLLQGIQGLMFRLQAVRQMLPARASEAASQLDTALETGDKAIEAGRDAVRDLRELHPIQGDLSETLAAFGEEFTDPSGSQRPSYRVLIEGEPRMLDPLIRDEVYRIAREAIRNAFKHARATHIEAELVYLSIHFCIRVRDDGMGIDPHVLAHGRNDGHWGLPGMRERASGFKGEFNVWSQTGAGTEVELKIPAQTAYVRPARPWWLPQRGSRGKVDSESPL